MVIYEDLGTVIRAYSDSGLYIHGGDPEGDYAEAVDPVRREYTETDKPIGTVFAEKAEAYDILTGGIE